MGASRLFGEPLERDFVVRDLGLARHRHLLRRPGSTSTLTFDQAVADTTELTEQLRARFHQDRIHLSGNSYGTLLGIRAVKQRPDLFVA